MNARYGVRAGTELACAESAEEARAQFQKIVPNTGLEGLKGRGLRSQGRDRLRQQKQCGRECRGKHTGGDLPDHIDVGVRNRQPDQQRGALRHCEGQQGTAAPAATIVRSSLRRGARR